MEITRKQELQLRILELQQLEVEEKAVTADGVKIERGKSYWNTDSLNSPEEIFVTKDTIFDEYGINSPNYIMLETYDSLYSTREGALDFMIRSQKSENKVYADKLEKGLKKLKELLRKI